MSDTPAPSVASDRGRVGRLLRHPLAWVVAVGLLVLLPLLWATGAARVDHRPPPILSRLPDFRLVDQDGRQVTAESLRGRPWVAGVLFTRCPTVCPQLLETVRAVERDTRLSAADARFVFFTADPEHDRPEVLAAHAREKGVDSERFLFLTGELEAVRAAVLEGLRLGLGEDGEAPFGIFHATHVVLVDRDLNLRGYHASDDPEAMDSLVRDLVLLSTFTRESP